MILKLFETMKNVKFRIGKKKILFFKLFIEIIPIFMNNRFVVPSRNKNFIVITLIPFTNKPDLFMVINERRAFDCILDYDSSDISNTF
jgi:hypothetical protein